ncbi:MAG TPA: hypothetical protein VMZ25_01580, partial [Terriglobales bacterium]|nr:hypothetical protein [Terriglobales bacterium]
AAFLDGQITFSDIPRTIKSVLNETADTHPESIKQVLSCDERARLLAQEIVRNRGRVTKVTAN